MTGDADTRIRERVVARPAAPARTGLNASFPAAKRYLLCCSCGYGICSGCGASLAHPPLPPCPMCGEVSWRPDPRFGDRGVRANPDAGA